MATKPTVITINGTPAETRPIPANPSYDLTRPDVSPFDPVPEAPSLRQEIEANWELSLVDQGIYRLGEYYGNDPEAGFNPWDHLDGYELYADSLVNTRSTGEIQQMKARIDRNQQTRDLLARGEWGWMASLAAGVGDPINLIPVPGAMGMGFVKGAAVASVGNVAITAATSPLALMADPTTNWEEQAYSIGGAALFGAAMGGIAGSIGRKTKGSSRRAMDAFAVAQNADEGMNISRRFDAKEEGYDVVFGNTRSLSPEGVYEPVAIRDVAGIERSKGLDGELYHYDDTHGWVLEADRGQPNPRAIADEVRDALGMPEPVTKREMLLDEAALRAEYERGQWKEDLGPDAIRSPEEFVTFRQIEAVNRRQEPKLQGETGKDFSQRIREVSLRDLAAGRADASVMEKTGLEYYLDKLNFSTISKAIKLVKGDNILTDLPLQLGGDYGWAIRANKFGYKTPPSVLVRSLKHGASYVEVKQGLDLAWLKHVQKNQQAKGLTVMSYNITASAEAMRAGVRSAMGGKVITKTIFSKMAGRAVFDLEPFKIDGFDVVPEARAAAKAMTRVAQRYDRQARELGIFYDQRSLKRTLIKSEARLVSLKAKAASWLWGSKQAPSKLQPAVKVSNQMFFGDSHELAVQSAMDELGPDIDLTPDSYGYVDNLVTSNDQPTAPVAISVQASNKQAAFVPVSKVASATYGEMLTLKNSVGSIGDFQFEFNERGGVRYLRVRSKSGKKLFQSRDGGTADSDVTDIWGVKDPNIVEPRQGSKVGIDSADANLPPELTTVFREFLTGSIDINEAVKRIKETPTTASKEAVSNETIAKPVVQVTVDGQLRTYDGISHMDALAKAAEDIGASLEQLLNDGMVEDGFATSTGRFVDRAEAATIAGTDGDLSVEALGRQADQQIQARTPARTQPQFRKLDDVLQSRIDSLSPAQKERWDDYAQDIEEISRRRDQAKADLEKMGDTPHVFRNQYGEPEPYFPRFWHKAQIAEKRAQFERLLVHWYRRDNPLGAEERAAKTVDDMLKADSGLDEDTGVPGLAHLHKRQLDIPNSFRVMDGELGELAIADFIETDLDIVSESYTRTMGAKIETAEMFGDTELFDKIMDVKQHWRERYIDKASEGADLATIFATRDEYLGWVRLTRDAVLGGLRNKEAYNFTNRQARNLKNVQVLNSMGRVLLTAAPEAMRLPMVNGFGTAFKAIWTRLFAEMKLKKGNIELSRQTGGLFELALDRHNSEIYSLGLTDPNGGGRWIERKLEQTLPAFFKLVGLSQWTVMMKDITMFATQHRILDYARNIDNPKYETALGSMGISRRDAKLLASMPTDEHHSGLILPAVNQWHGPDGRRARQLFLDALTGEANRTIITPSIADKSLLFSGVAARKGKKVAESDWFSVPLQFMSFGVAANQKLLMSALQGRDHSAVAGALAVLAGGVIANYMRTPSSALMNKSADELLLEGYETAGLGGFWFGDLNGQIERLTRHTIGVRPLLGMDPRYGKTTDVGDYVDALGPGPSTWFDVARTFYDPEMSATNKAQAIRRAVPFNNVIWWGSVSRDLATMTGKALE